MKNNGWALAIWSPSGSNESLNQFPKKSHYSDLNFKSRKPTTVSVLENLAAFHLTEFMLEIVNDAAILRVQLG